MWRLLISNFVMFEKIIYSLCIYVFFVIFLNEKDLKYCCKCKVRIAFFIHLHTVIMKDVGNMRNIIKRGKTSVLLNRCWNIYICI